MKKISVYVAVLFALSCTKQVNQVNQNVESISSNLEYQSGRMSFSNESALCEFVHRLANGDKVALNELATKSSTDEFQSLYQARVDEVMSQFDDATLAEIERRGLVYEPEDSIVYSMEMCKVLNADREVCVGDYVYRYIDDGMLTYPKSKDGSGGLGDNIIEQEQFVALEDGETIDLSGDVKFTRIKYGNFPPSGNTNTDTTEPEEPSQSFYDVLSGNLFGGDVVVPQSNIVKYEFVKNGGDANNFQKWISSLCGINVTAHNYFDDKHRMVLRVYSEHIIVWQGTGMTVRMQEKFMGIWWRKKAQEFRYGWLGPLCYYKYTGPTAVGSLMAIAKQTPSSSYVKPIVLFNVPLGDLKDLSVKDQDIEKVLYDWLKNNKSAITNFQKTNQDYKDSPKGLFSTDKDDGIYYLFPPREEKVSNNSGRDVVRWDNDFMIGITVGFNLNTATISSVAPCIPKVKEIEIKRVFSYAAVKYNDIWRLCVIYS